MFVDTTANGKHDFEHKHYSTGIYRWSDRQELPHQFNKEVVCTKIKRRGQCHTYLCLGLAAHIKIRPSNKEDMFLFPRFVVFLPDHLNYSSKPMIHALLCLEQSEK